jgi:hypothetical protein
MRTFMAIFAAMAVVLPAAAESFDPEDVSNDATWFAHADVTKLKKTELGTQVLKMLNQNAAQLDALWAVLRFDVRTDLKAITLYATGEKPEEAVAILKGKFQEQHLITLFKANPTYETSEQGKHVVHSWVDENSKKRQWGCFVEPTTVAISEHKEAVLTAIDVLDGEVDSLEDSKLYKGVTDDGGAFLTARVNLAEIGEINPEAAVLKEAKAGHFAISEADGSLDMRMVLVGKNVESAALIRDTANGMLAMAMLNREKNPQLAKVASSFKVALTDNDVSVKMKFSTLELMEMAQKMRGGRRGGAAGADKGEEDAPGEQQRQVFP